MVPGPTTPDSPPGWLEPLVRATREMRAEDLTTMVAPAGSQTRAGAVLLLFGEGPSGPDLLLTERAHDMRSHPGQVSFPGGSVDPDDDSAEDTALREATEETGLDRAGVQVLGRLPALWLPPSNFTVTPVVGWWRSPSPVAVVDPAEVRTVLRVPVADLLDPDRRVSVHHPSGYTGPGFRLEADPELLLWGFTAGIVSRLFDFVGWTRPWDSSVTAELPAYMLGGRA